MRLAAYLLFVIITVSAPLQAARVSDIDLPDQVVHAGAELPLRSTALLRWMFVRAYAGGLYLPADVAPAQYGQDVPKCLVLHYFVGIGGRRFPEVVATILGRMYDEAQLAELRPRLDQVDAAYVDVAKGDRYWLCYAPGNGTTLAHNDRALVTVAGADFASVYFSIWLGSDPANAAFRDTLLGAD